MYYIKKEIEVAGSHYLELNYESKCQNIHGHNWIITMYLKSEELDSNGMVMDFTLMKQKIHDKMDHHNLNSLFDFNPTAENIAKWICDELGEKCYKVDVEESKNNIATYERI